MPVWLQVLAALASLLVCGQSTVYFWNRFFRTKRSSDIDTTLDSLKGGTWTPAERILLEHRLTKIEGSIMMLLELHELREKIMANILHSPHRPELDKLLEKINDGTELSDAELMWAKQWLWEIVKAVPGDDVTKGEQSVAGDLYASISVKYKHKLKGREAHA